MILWATVLFNSSLFHTHRSVKKPEIYNTPKLIQTTTQQKRKMTYKDKDCFRNIKISAIIHKMQKLG
uniref:Uncharacterized protein n=1 Tax=Cucumis melo TaxID=3656 RepID=A0A9I9EKJ5_CUCME